MPFVFNEDQAIKKKLTGITVTDENAPPPGRTVAVRFRLPETELANATFPMIVIDPAGPVKDSEREHRGRTRLPYIPEQAVDPVVYIDPKTGNTVPWDPAEDYQHSPFVVDYPIPFNFDYTITVLSRKQSHMVQLMNTLSQIQYLPARFGYVEVDGDETLRSLFLIGGPEVAPLRDTDGKRLFRVVYRVRIPSEIYNYQYKQLLEGDYIKDIDLDLEVIPES